MILFYVILALAMLGATVAPVAEYRANRRYERDAERRIARGRREIDELPPLSGEWFPGRWR
jgi:Mn2+/Fe2+ NRAMP family transporter